MTYIESFQILGLDPRAFPDMHDLKKAYRNMAKLYHPDRFDNDKAKQLKAELRMTQINLAFQVASGHLKNVHKNTRSKVKDTPKRPENNKRTTQTKKRTQTKKTAQTDGEEKQRDSEYHAKTGKSQKSFFSWCRDIMGEILGKKDNFRTKSGKGNGIDSESEAGDDLKRKKKADGKKKQDGQYRPGQSNGSVHKSTNPKRDRKFFADMLRESSRSSPSKYGENNLEEDTKNGSHLKTKESSDQKQPIKSGYSFRRYVKRKQKFMDSYAGPVEKIAPVSRVQKI